MNCPKLPRLTGVFAGCRATLCRSESSRNLLEPINVWLGMHRRLVSDITTSPNKTSDRRDRSYRPQAVRTVCSDPGQPRGITTTMDTIAAIGYNTEPRTQWGLRFTRLNNIQFGRNMTSRSITRLASLCTRSAALAIAGRVSARASESCSVSALSALKIPEQLPAILQEPARSVCRG